MLAQATTVERRQFLRTACAAGAAVFVPQVIPAAVLGKDGAANPA